MTKRFMIDDAGTLIDKDTRDTYDYVSDVCDILNELDEDFHDAVTVLFEAQEKNRVLEKNYNELKQLIHTMLRQIDVDKINTDNARYSARIIFTREEFALITDIWNGDD